MRILHSEASPGWGGQEMRIVSEAIGMRQRGHQLYFAVQKGGGIAAPLRKEGFTVYEMPFEKKHALTTFFKLFLLVLRYKIEVINTHSSLDSWLAGFVGRILRKKIIRTRHLSTSIRKGINSRILYNFLASHVVTTCEEVVSVLQKQALLPAARICSIATGIDPRKMKVDEEEVERIRARYYLEEDDLVIGCVAVFRGWKGIEDLLRAAYLLKKEKKIKFLLVGSGVSEAHFRAVHKELALEKSVFFTGHLSPPFPAIAAMDIFALLSWANEGVSQASLQAAYLEKPLITTSIGGLKEVCLHEKTGMIVPAHSPEAVAEAILRLSTDSGLRKAMGKNAKTLVEREFLFETMLNKMEKVYGVDERI